MPDKKKGTQLVSIEKIAASLFFVVAERVVGHRRDPLQRRRQVGAVDRFGGFAVGVKVVFDDVPDAGRGD
jgi:hypothetical protein